MVSKALCVGSSSSSSEKNPCLHFLPKLRIKNSQQYFVSKETSFWLVQRYLDSNPYTQKQRISSNVGKMNSQEDNDHPNLSNTLQLNADNEGMDEVIRALNDLSPLPQELEGSNPEIEDSNLYKEAGNHLFGERDGENLNHSEENMAEEAYVSTYNFFARMNVEKLKNVCKVWKIKRTAPKYVLMARCVVHAYENAKKKTIDEISLLLSLNSACDGFSSFLQTKDKKWISKPPSISILKEAVTGDIILPSSQSRHSSDFGRSTANEPDVEKEREGITVNEIARLMILIRDTKGREALRKTREELTVAELDAGIRRYAPWNDTIARIFNNSDFKPCAKFDGFGLLTDVTCAFPPDKARTGGFLRREFDKVRLKFKTCYDKWSNSDHCGVQNFVKFVKNEIGSIAAVSKQLLVIFEVLKCGTPEVDEDLLYLVTTEMKNEDVPKYEIDSDGGENDVEITPSSSFPSLPSSAGSRKRKKRDNKEENEKRMKVNLEREEMLESMASDFMNVLKAYQLPKLELRKSPSGSTSEAGEASKMKNSIEMSKQRVEMFKTLQSAKKDLDNTIKTGDSLMIEAARQMFDMVYEEWLKYHHREQKPE